MDDNQLLRYSRQILLPQIEVSGQEKLAQTTVFIAGLGGLGSPVAMYLAAAGIGHLILADFDRVDLSNLQRQIIHETSQIGQLKITSAQARLRALNPEVQTTLVAERLEPNVLETHVKKADVVVDCSDNFPTRFALNAVCVQQKKPLVSGAAQRFTGQVSVFLPLPTSPCYRCLYTDEEGEGETCTETGIIAPLSGIIGSIQALEVIKVILNLGEVLNGKLLLLDALTMEWRSLKIRRDLACPVCSAYKVTNGC